MWLAQTVMIGNIVLLSILALTAPAKESMFPKKGYLMWLSKGVFVVTVTIISFLILVPPTQKAPIVGFQQTYQSYDQEDEGDESSDSSDNGVRRLPRHGIFKYIFFFRKAF